MPMPSLTAFVAAIALALGSGGGGLVPGEPPMPSIDVEYPQSRDMTNASAWQALADSYRPADAHQVRIEQHIIWRVTPMPGPARDAALSLAPQAQAAPRLSERKMSGCIPMSWIAGGQPQAGSRLLLFLRDRRLVAADLERACSARDFYSGFYVDKPDADGRLCAGRDRILARSGARCSISAFRLLVADD